MGNRAVVSFNTSPKSPALYFHWNGGRASIDGFMSACRKLGYKSINEIEFALRPWFGNLSLYRGTVESTDTDNGDNGWYVLNKNIEIKSRQFNRYSEEVDPEKTIAIEKEILSLNLGHCRYECLTFK